MYSFQYDNIQTHTDFIIRIICNLIFFFLSSFFYSSFVHVLPFHRYEIVRVENVGLVLQEFDVCQQQMKEEEAKIRMEQEKLAKVFSEQIGGEEGRMKKIVKNRYKIQNVTMGENKLLKMRRKKYEKNVTEKKNNGSKYLQKLTVRKFSPFPGTSLLHGQ